jgi:hypothetical protein
MDMCLLFSPVVRSREAFMHVCGHELFHFYQRMYLHIDYPDPLIDVYTEACADIVSIKAVGSKKYWEDYGKKHYYARSMVMTLAEQMKDMSREELIQFITFPKKEKDLKPLIKKIMELLDKADHAKWIRRMEEIKKKKDR